jgi:hypothetical protein
MRLFVVKRRGRSAGEALGRAGGHRGLFVTKGPWIHLQLQVVLWLTAREDEPTGPAPPIGDGVNVGETHLELLERELLGVLPTVNLLQCCDCVLVCGQARQGPLSLF